MKANLDSFNQHVDNGEWLAALNELRQLRRLIMAKLSTIDTLRVCRCCGRWREACEFGHQHVCRQCMDFTATVNDN